MPYKIEKVGPHQFDVVVIDTGKVKAEEPTRAKAEAVMRALYANVPEARRDKPKP